MTRGLALGINLVAIGVSMLAPLTALVVPRWLADASSAVTGPGVSVRVVDRWAAGASTMRLQVTAYGGSGASIREVAVYANGERIGSGGGLDPHWKRGSPEVLHSERALVEATLPDVVPESIGVVVRFVCALPRDPEHTLDVPLEESLRVSMPSVGTDASRALALLAGWALFCVLWAAMGRLVDRHRAAPELAKAIGCVTLAATFVGAEVCYWGISEPLSVALGDPPGLVIAVTAAFILLPPLGLIVRARARSPRHARPARVWE